MVDLFRTSKSIPTERILQLKKQGLDNDQVIQALQREGFKSSEIFDALQQAELKESITGPVSLDQESSTVNPISPEFEDLPPPPGRTNVHTSAIDDNRVEEIAEAIIDEKWDVLVESVNKIVEWKEKVDSEIKQLQETVSGFNATLSKITEGVSEKLEEYDHELSDVKADVMAQNKVLRKALPDILGEHEVDAEPLDNFEEENKEASVEENHKESEEKPFSIDDIE
jgi:uncharacterized phage infection (PIP) family protein YhgE